MLNIRVRVKVGKMRDRGGWGEMDGLVEGGGGEGSVLVV